MLENIVLSSEQIAQLTDQEIIELGDVYITNPKERQSFDSFRSNHIRSREKEIHHKTQTKLESELNLLETIKAIQRLKTEAKVLKSKLHIKIIYLKSLKGKRLSQKMKFTQEDTYNLSSKLVKIYMAIEELKQDELKLAALCSNP